MGPRSKKEYRETIFLRYKRASRTEKSRILDEFCAIRGYHRKHAIRVLRKFKHFTKPKPKRGADPSAPDPADVTAVEKELEHARVQVASGRYDIIILNEINNAVDYSDSNGLVYEGRI